MNLVDDNKIDDLIKKYVINNKDIIFLRNSIIITGDVSKNLKNMFSFNVKEKLNQIFNKTYRIEFSKREREDLHVYFKQEIKFVVFKNNKEIYSEEYDEFMPYPKKIRYNTFYTSKPFLFDYKKFWWRLNLEKAKMLLDVKI